MAGDCNKFLAFLDKYTHVEIDDLISTAMTQLAAEVDAGSLATEAASSVILSGKYGLSHALQVNLALTGVQKEGGDLTCASFMSIAYFYARELDARGTTDVATWSLDSRLDFLIPLLYTRKFLRTL